MENTTSCFECNNSFRPGRKTQRFCSRPCKVRWHARDWRHRNPERAKEIDDKSHAPRRAERVANTARWREEHREYVREFNKSRWTGDRRDLANLTRALVAKAERVDKPWKKSFGAAKTRTRIKQLPPFALTEAWAEARWTGYCELTGLPFTIGKMHGEFFSPSLDRIKPSKGYVPDNCRFILWCVNAFKGQGSDEDMMLVALAITKYAAKSIGWHHQMLPPNP